MFGPNIGLISSSPLEGIVWRVRRPARTVDLRYAVAIWEGTEQRI